MNALPARDTTATLHFLSRSTETARIRFEARGPGSIDEHVPRTSQRERITDARRREGVTLDTHGVALLHRPTAADPYHPDERYDAEIEAILREVAGAREVLVFDHTHRFEDADGATRREPVHSVHYDYTDASGAKRMRDLLPAEAAARWARGRYAIFNLWRPIRAAVERAPLAFVDERFTSDHDRGLIELVYPDRVGGNYGLHPREGLRWLYFPRMTPDEIVVFKTFDSDPEQSIRYVGHTAFEDERHPAPRALPRRSIETRALVRLR